MRLKDFLKGQDRLNPLLFSAYDQLLPEVRQELIRIGRDFLDQLPIKVTVIDLRLVGAQTGKYYTKHSDIDLHWVGDFSRETCLQTTMELLDVQRRLYNLQSRPRVQGLPVELYIENHLSPARGGAYSVLADQWIRKSPDPKAIWDPRPVNRELAKISRNIQQVIKHGKRSDQQLVMKKLYLLRARGLDKAQGEFSRENVVFKILRNRGLIHKLRRAINRLS